jgi:hypothetical protein
VVLIMCISDVRPQNHQELFNLRHSSARNVIQRIFGVIKSRFEVINSSCQYDIKTQVKIIIVMSFLHNFIRVTEPQVVLARSDERSSRTDRHQPETVEYGVLHRSGITRQESARASNKQDEIALQMWADYQALLQHRQRHGQAGGPV